MPTFQTIEVDTSIVACDGDHGTPGGHPKVYLNLTGAGRVECPYCSRLYVRKAAHGHGLPGTSAAAPKR
jgi:uncharacterized Zn-finger protein